jgi:4'-phosphopantetheinyl transferase
LPMYKEAEFPESLRDVIVQAQPDRAKFPSLLKGEVHLWTASLVPSTEKIERLQSFLLPEENRKASYFKFVRKQHEYIITQAVLRILISAYLDIEPADVMLVASKKGKPFLINEPSLFFNISNSHEICVYAFSRDAEVGIDIEKIRELPDIDQLIEKNLTSREKAYFLKNTDHKLSLFFQFWTYKESYLKAIGEGMRLTPENLEFSLDNGNIRLRSVTYGFEDTDWQFIRFTREENYTGTLTYQRKDTVIREIN